MADHKHIVGDLSDTDASDEVLADLLARLKTSADEGEIRELSDRLTEVVFHKQMG
jgi:hypothetical protein